MRQIVPLLVLALLSSAASSQTPGSCVPGRATGQLDIGEVEATAYTTGTLFYGPGGAEQYVVPKLTGIPPIYNASLWVGGTVEGTPLVSGATYYSPEFWPGPLDPGAMLPNPVDCSAYDLIWVVSVQDVSAYERDGTATTDLAEWPVGLGAPAVDASGAPVVPTSRGQTLGLAAGERPDLLGQQSAFWVMNDVGNVHRSLGSAPLGVEVRVLAGAFLNPTSPTLTRATAWRFEIVNRSRKTIEDLRASLFIGWQLGNGSDDYVGVDTTRSLSFVYNADNRDGGTLGYGLAPPAIGFDLLTGASSSMYYIGGDANRSPPSDATQADRLMRGIWRDGTPLTRSESGYNREGTPTVWAYPARAEYGEFWSEMDASSTPGLQPAVPGQRDVQFTSRPVLLEAGAFHAVDGIMLYARGNDHLRSLENLRDASDFVQVWYDAGRLFPAFRAPVASEASLGADPLALRIGPNPVTRRTTVSYVLPVPATVRLAVLDVLGREVAVLHAGPRAAGPHEATLDASPLAPGVYAAVLQTGAGRAARPLTVAR